MTRQDRYRLLVDGVESVFSWGDYLSVDRAADIAHDSAPDAEIRIRPPDVVVYPARIRRTPKEGS